MEVAELTHLGAMLGARVCAAAVSASSFTPSFPTGVLATDES